MLHCPLSVSPGHLVMTSKISPATIPDPFFFLNSDSSTSLWSLPDVAGDLDSQTIEVLASWMLEHPLTEEQQAADSPRPEGAPDTPSPDGPETVQCPERPTSQPSERSEFLQTFFCYYYYYLSFVILSLQCNFYKYK